MDELSILKNSVKEFNMIFDKKYKTSIQSESKWLREAFEILQRATGKQVRPLMVALTCKACGGQLGEKSAESALLLELIHTATLIHDDVIDKAGLRRGVRTLNTIFDNRIAVLMGDFVLSIGLMRAIQLNDIQIISVVSSIGKELSEGEILQMETAEETVLSEQRYFQIIKQKTATLFSAATLLGAICADADNEIKETCRAIGENLGYAFQIRDDIFDYFSVDVGKPTGNDIREGKVTLPLLYAIFNDHSKEQEQCLNIIKTKDFTPSNIDRLIVFAKDKDGVEYARLRMSEYLDKALELCQKLPNISDVPELERLAKFICNREI
ncbi:polyprenyl synthetase family protein [Falsiporphyromonas endometrii]|uniref:Polyprenyl synthetase family protein n=1 Tax=Falsiporphyromonas endometrii TaxID=1387297 RepID=A0ABV9K829_9PORP